MQARMKNPVTIIPEARQAMRALGAAAEKGGLPPITTHLVHLRASQINGCSLCVEMHARELRHAGESEEKVFAVAAWRDAPYFSDAERAALALAEAVTRISDKADAVPDDIWNEAVKHYNEQQLSALLVAIGAINVWNRLNVATRQIAGQWAKSAEGQKSPESQAAAR